MRQASVSGGKGYENFLISFPIGICAYILPARELFLFNFAKSIYQGGNEKLLKTDAKLIHPKYFGDEEKMFLNFKNILKRFQNF